MGTRSRDGASKPTERREVTPPAGDAAITQYVLRLNADYGRYACPADETRRLVDESMGAVSLTELLYKSREDGAK
jgi:hypothetical protein